MKILYSAIDQSVPAAHGGSVHVTSVARGLAALGHEVHVLATPGSEPFPAGAPHWRSMRPPFGLRQLRVLRTPDVLRVAQALRPDVIIERYYNFGGEAIVAARRMRATAVLEVNAPIVDYPGSPKRRLDTLLLVQPMRRWREWQCRAADLIVTPSAKILPADVPASRVLEIEWGADTDRFHPAASGPVPFSRAKDDVVAIFVGAFRRWHGAIHLVEAMRQLRARGRHDIKAVFVGDGPELGRVREASAGLDGVMVTGPLPHDQIPACLAAADLGVAPFDLAGHPSLGHEFHWSPLKIFEYMAAGLPVVAPRIDRLALVVRDGHEGVLYDPHDSDGTALSRAIEQAARPEVRAALGAAARTRAVDRFGWRRHCEQLVRAIRNVRAGRPASRACAS
jgi:glycosyltransferase involved in cell wall biosynthesis